MLIGIVFFPFHTWAPVRVCACWNAAAAALCISSLTFSLGICLPLNRVLEEFVLSCVVVGVVGERVMGLRNTERPRQTDRNSEGTKMRITGRREEEEARRGAGRDRKTRKRARANHMRVNETTSEERKPKKKKGNTVRNGERGSCERE